MHRRGMKEDTMVADGTMNGGGLGYDKPWYSASCNLGPPRGRAFQSNSRLQDNVAYSRSSPSASPLCNETFKPFSPHGTSATRKSGRPASLGDRQKRAASGNGRSRIQHELEFQERFSPLGAIDDRETTPRETPRSAEKALRSILKHEASKRTKSCQDLLYRKLEEDDDNMFASAASSKQHDWPYTTPSRQQSSQTQAPASLPPPPFRQSRIPRYTFFNGNDDFRQTRSPPDRCQSSNACCYRRPKISMVTQYPRRREDAGAKKMSDAKFQTETERSALRELGCATGGQFSGTSDWGVAGGSRSITGRDDVESGRRVEPSNPNYDRMSTRRVQSENDVRRNPGRSPRKDQEECFSDEVQHSRRFSLRDCFDIVTENSSRQSSPRQSSPRQQSPRQPSPRQPSPRQSSPRQPLKSVAHDGAPPSRSLERTDSSRPYYRRIYDWLSNFADTHFQMIKHAAENYIPVTRIGRTTSDPKGLCCKSCSKTQAMYPPDNNCKAPTNLAGQTPCFCSTCSGQEQCPSVNRASSTEDKWGTFRRQQNPEGEPKASNSRPEVKSPEGQSCHSRTPMRTSDLTTSTSAMEIAVSRLDRMQENAAVAITQMRGPDFVLPKKLKSETLLTKSLTKDFEEAANAPSSCRRTAQLRKLLSELPAENSYVVEWLVTNNIVTESNASRFGRLFKVKPHVLEVLTRHREVLFPNTL